MLPYLALFLVLSGTGFICDSVIRRRLLSVLAVRKLVTVVGKFLIVDLCDLSRDISLYYDYVPGHLCDSPVTTVLFIFLSKFLVTSATSAAVYI